MENEGRLKGKRILVADDDRNVNEVMKDMLEEYGGDVIQAFDGASAVDLFIENLPDMVLLDYRMPKMDGMDVLKEIQARNPNALVVFMTGEGSEHVAVAAMKAGAKDYITKPISFPEFIPVVVKLFHDYDVQQENLELKARGDAYKAYLVTLSETMGEALITTDSLGNILYMNFMARKLWGSEKKMKGSPAGILFYDKDEYILENIVDALSGELHWFENEYTFRKTDGSTFSGLLTASALKKKDNKGGLVIVVRDLTEIDDMRRQMINAEKMASLGKVVEGVAHEIRNSLTSLGGFSRRLDRCLNKEMPERVYLTYILEDVKRLETMIMDIENYVNYTKIHRPRFAMTGLEDIIDKALIKTMGAGKFKGITYNVNMPEHIGEIHADHNYLVEAFWHLFVNACEAMGDNGLLDIDISKNTNFIIVDIKDVGKGIPKEDIKEIFNPFYTSKVQGAGLGLSKVYMIIEEHGGFITVDSSEQTGTKMRVFLPIKKTLKTRPPRDV
ncbi:MAG: response regulator [Thermodesulfobacteriota bacterium]|nr:response regulator [Thermodesulfobacteriota bacterium]